MILLGLTTKKTLLKCGLGCQEANTAKKSYNQVGGDGKHGTPVNFPLTTWVVPKLTVLHIRCHNKIYHPTGPIVLIMTRMAWQAFLGASLNKAGSTLTGKTVPRFSRLW